MKGKLISRKTGLEVKLKDDFLYISSKEDKFIPYCTMKKETCYQSYRFKCPNYDEYIVKNEIKRS